MMQEYFKQISGNESNNIKNIDSVFKEPKKINVKAAETDAEKVLKDFNNVIVKDKNYE